MKNKNKKQNAKEDKIFLKGDQKWKKDKLPDKSFVPVIIMEYIYVHN